MSGVCTQRETSRLVRLLDADNANVNGVIPHPQLPLLVTYGIDSDAKIWAPCEGSRRHWGGGHGKLSRCSAAVQSCATLPMWRCAYG